MREGSGSLSEAGETAEGFVVAAGVDAPRDGGGVGGGGAFSIAGCGPTGDGMTRPAAGFASGADGRLSGAAGTTDETGSRGSDAETTGAPVLWKSITSRYGLYRVNTL